MDNSLKVSSIAASEIAVPNGIAESPNQKPNILLLTTSLLTDRMFIYSKFLKRLSKRSRIRIWAASCGESNYKEVWNDDSIVVDSVEEFPVVNEAPLLHTYLRRLNEFVWDYKYAPPSRISLYKHRSYEKRLDVKALRPLARFLAKRNLEVKLEDNLEKLMLSNLRSEDALSRLQKLKPSVVVVTGPFQFQQPAVISAIKKLNIPMLSLIPSWDNISTKNRMVFKYDGYLVWSEQLKKELHAQYRHTRNRPVYVIGAPQFDVFRDESFRRTRAEFCASQNLNPDASIIVYGLGSPGFLNEMPGALHLAQRITKGELGNVQMLVRAHPLFDDGKLHEFFKDYAPYVRVQSSPENVKKGVKRSQDREQIIEWINTFRHADVVVNLSSTVTIDAAIFDRPVVNLDFDPQPGQPDQSLIKDINHLWTHFKPIAESGGVWLVNDFDEMVEAVKEYLKNPRLHQKQRRWIAEYVCGYLDGQSGERMAEAIFSFSKSVSQSAQNI